MAGRKAGQAQLNVRISATLDAALKEAAEREETTVTEYVKRVLRESIPPMILAEYDRKRLGLPVDALRELGAFNER